MYDRFAEWNQKMESQSQAKEYLSQCIQNMMVRFDLDNAQTTSVLAKLTAQFAHSSFHENQMKIEYEKMRELSKKQKENRNDRE